MGILIEFPDGTILFVVYTPRAEIDEHPIPTFPGLNLGRKILSNRNIFGNWNERNIELEDVLLSVCVFLLQPPTTGHLSWRNRYLPSVTVTLKLWGTTCSVGKVWKNRVQILISWSCGWVSSSWTQLDYSTILPWLDQWSL